MSSYSAFSLNKEISTVVFKNKARFKVALIYPNSYALGMSNLGVHTIYSLLNKRPDTLCERVFYEPKQKKITSLENRRSLSSFDILAFSISYELDYFNAIKILSQLDMFAQKEKRALMPLIVIGGIVNSFNFLPLSRYSDAIFVGEAEESLVEFMDKLSEYPSINSSEKKERFLREVSYIGGIFIPGINRKEIISPRYLADVNQYPTTSKILTPFTEFSNTFLVEISRGCPHRCSFCATGAVCGNFRPRDVHTLISEIDRGMKITSRIGLVAAAVSDYPDIEKLASFLKFKKANVSVSSLRIETVDACLLRILAESGQRSVTFAPETGSERLRKFINKKTSNKQIMEKIKLAKECGIKRIKLYFMVGLPSEEDDDIQAILRLVKEASYIIPIKVNLGIFVPKPKTPFAAERFAEKKLLSARLKFLRTGLAAKKNITLSTTSIREAKCEALLANADEDFFGK